MAQKNIWCPSCVQGIHAYIPIANVDHRTEFFSIEAFTYDAERDVYLCPAGKELQFWKLQNTGRSRRYRSPREGLQSLPTQSQVYHQYPGMQPLPQCR